MTTLFIRYPARASVDSGAAQTCPYALVGDGGHLQQQGADALGNLGQLVAGAQRVVLILAAADVSLLRVAAPPLSGARLKAALPALVEDQLLGDPADCVLGAAPAEDDGVRTVAVVQRAWLEVLVKALVAQGAHRVAAVPAQLCLPFQPGAVSAAITAGEGGYELAMRQSPFQGVGLSLALDPEAALHTVRALAGSEPVTLYLPQALAAQFAPVLARLADAGQLHGVALAEDNWAHWISAARAAQPDLAAGLGALGTTARRWQQWRWPVRLALLALLVNVAGLNIEWLRMKREADAVRLAMLRTFKAAYPNDAPLYPLEQMRRNLATAKGNSGQLAPDEFTALGAALGEALSVLPRKDVIDTLEYKERALLVKLKPNVVDAAAQAQVRSALAARKLELSEPQPGSWRISLAGGKA
ncbi:type II secretion system protein GspL [Oxalobacteraceae bacterium A2-2]